MPDTRGEAGIPAPNFRLPPATRLGRVRLQVADLERSIRFYGEILGLVRLESDTREVPQRAVLGTGREPLIELVERPGARPVAPQSRLGLYHVAILLPDRRDLGRFVRHAAEKGIRLGMADHVVSEAVYLSDPDGLGLEVYADRPRDQWARNGAEIRMATDPLDVRSLTEPAGSESWSAAPAGTTIGHVHLHVGDIGRAAAFYHEALGLDKIVWSYPGALFLSAGGYHHHLGTNVWARGAQPAGEDDARLLEWTIVLPTQEHVDEAHGSVEDAGFDVRTNGETWTAADPWGTRVRVKAE